MGEASVPPFVGMEMPTLPFTADAFLFPTILPPAAFCHLLLEMFVPSLPLGRCDHLPACLPCHLFR